MTIMIDDGVLTEEYVSVKTASNLAGVTEQTIYNWMRERKIKTVKEEFVFVNKRSLLEVIANR